jgi:FixJ family two-component response regulator
MIERLRKSRPNLPVILMSPLDVSDAAQHVKFLKKPFTVQNLLGALGELGRHKEAKPA